MTVPAATRLRGLRGATTITDDAADLVRDATQEMVRELMARNALRQSDIVSAVFTVTADIRSGFPATAARMLGWTDVAMLSAVEIDVPGAMARVIRVLVHAELPSERLPRHVYLHGAVALRPDWA